MDTWKMPDIAGMWDIWRAEDLGVVGKVFGFRDCESLGVCGKPEGCLGWAVGDPGECGGET